MNWVADENVDRRIVEKLREAGYTVRHMADEAPGASDETLLALAEADGAILITSDKDFGELFFHSSSTLPGVVLLRLSRLRPERRTTLVLQAIRRREPELLGAITVITPRSTRVRRRARSRD